MIDGVAVKNVLRHADERGFFAELIRVNDPFFTEGFAQLSRSSMVTGVVKAWHIHKTQVDWWYIVAGLVKVALYDTREASATHKTLDEYVLGEEGKDIILKIPPGVAHGLKVLKGKAELIYITSSVYDKEKEEGRIPHNDPSISYDWIQGMPISNKNIT